MSARDRLRQSRFARMSLDAQSPDTQVTRLRPEEDVAGVAVLRVTDIDPYDGNPRSERNAAYEEIKASVLARGGLITRLTVTRRPGAERYMIASGGNTRLAILQELWAETEDRRFEYQQVLVEPWQSEFHVRAAHIIENTKRGEMSFWDRASACRQLKRDIERETGETLSQRRMAEAFALRGVEISRSMIQLYEYAVDYLAPLGRLLTNNAAKRLQPALTEFVQLARKFGTEPETLFAQTLWPAMERYSGQLAEAPETFAVHALCAAIAEDLAVSLSVPAATLRAWLDALRHDPAVSAAQLCEGSAQQSPARLPPPTGGIDAAADGTSLAKSAQAVEDEARAITQTTGIVEKQPTPMSVAAQDICRRDGAAPAPKPRPAVALATQDPADHVVAYAQRFAHATDLEACFVPSNLAPAGYYVDVLPFADCADPYLREASWWILAQLSGQLFRPVARALPPSSVWRQAFEGEEGDATSTSVALVLREANAHYDLSTRQAMVFADYLPLVMLHASGTGRLLSDLLQAVVALHEHAANRFSFTQDYLFRRKER
ncbi:ParB family protein [Ralstonia sp.]|uniref:ParB family protein n=1 Tax=Ralstonia sp. TaxID=54061 RepID=UPI0031D1E960